MLSECFKKNFFFGFFGADRGMFFFSGFPKNSQSSLILSVGKGDGLFCVFFFICFGILSGVGVLENVCRKQMWVIPHSGMEHCTSRCARYRPVRQLFFFFFNVFSFLRLLTCKKN